MLKLTKTGIGLLTKQYRSVLRKCWSINLGLFATTTALSIMVANISSAAYNNDERLIIITRDTYDVDNGYWVTDSSTGNNVAKLYNGWRRGGTLELFSQDGTNSTWIDPFKFSLNNSSYATGIDFAANVTAGTTDASHLATTGAVNQLLNYYYTFRVDERDEVIDSASFFQKNFLTLQKVDLQSKNPTHLGAFAKCDEVCPRPSERFLSSLSQEQMFKNNASVDAGTSRYCLQQFGDVVADLLKNTVAKGLRMYEFMNEEVCHA